jgi:hypothetical protein
VQSLLTANLTPHGIDAGETLESIPPIGLRRFRSRRGAGKHLTAEGQGLLGVTVGQQAVAVSRPFRPRLLDRPGTQGDALGILRITTPWAGLAPTPSRIQRLLRRQGDSLSCRACYRDDGRQFDLEAGHRPRSPRLRPKADALGKKHTILAA